MNDLQKKEDSFNSYSALKAATLLLSRYIFDGVFIDKCCYWSSISIRLSIRFSRTIILHLEFLFPELKFCKLDDSRGLIPRFIPSTLVDCGWGTIESQKIHESGYN